MVGRTEGQHIGATDTSSLKITGRIKNNSVYIKFKRFDEKIFC